MASLEDLEAIFDKIAASRPGASYLSYVEVSCLLGIFVAVKYVGIVIERILPR